MFAKAHVCKQGFSIQLSEAVSALVDGDPFPPAPHQESCGGGEAHGLRDARAAVDAEEAVATVGGRGVWAAQVEQKRGGLRE